MTNWIWLRSSSKRALALAALVLVSLTGCSVRSPGVDPEVVRVDQVGQQREQSGESMNKAARAPVTVEKESSTDESAKETGPSFAEKREQFSGPAQLDEPEALGRALAVFYRMRSRAFMAPVASHVQGVVNLGGSGDDRETRSCPEGGVFHLEWQGTAGERSGSRELLYQFDECRGRFGSGPMLLLNGDYRRDFRPLVGREQVIESFDVHGYQGQGSQRQPIALRGRQRVLRPAEGGVVRSTERMEMMLGETYTALKGVRDEIAPEEGESDSDFASFNTRFVTTVEGRLFSSELGGWLDMATATGLVEQQAPCSASGVVALSGKRNGEVRFGPHTGTHHRVALELESGEVARYERCSDFGEAFGFGR
ncbi:hypothetical protein [Salicola sp. Rm-C-2C1-2]|uniref:hypothetical protein n=1 Tax=Salicola sp. Rm-C-2C1-2 TaxID=3141321 RepID=UPI0032E3D933